MKWLAECSAEALGAALRVVLPELSGCSITIPGLTAKEEPLWHSSSAAVGEQFIAKFAWSRPAALRLAREIGVLTALTREPEVPFLPEVAASSLDPLLLVTKRVAGTSLFEVAGSIDRDRAGRQLARFLAALHHPAALERAEAAVGKLTGPGCRQPRPWSCATGSPAWSSRSSAASSCAGVIGPMRCSPALAPPCSCTAICMAITRCGRVMNSGWWWISRLSEPQSPNTTCVPFPVPGWGPALSC
jgi:hypothetical protein